MRYTTEDLAWYGGFILGTSGAFLLLGVVGLESHFPKLILSGCFGIGIGWLSQKTLKEKK